MNKDLSGLTQEADPNEVIKELKAAYQQVYEENKWLRADIESKDDDIDCLKSDIMGWKQGAGILNREIASLKAERDAYRKALEDIIEAFPWSWQAGRAAKVIDKYPSPKE